MEIKDKDLASKFRAIETQQVYKRLKYGTAILAIYCVVTALYNIGKVDKQLALAFNTGDILFVSTLMVILGRYSCIFVCMTIPALVVGRGIWAYTHLHMVVQQTEPFASHFDFQFFQSQMIMRIFIPCSMLFLVRFKIYLYVVLPLTAIAQGAMLSQVQPIYNEKMDCPKLSENFEFMNSFGRDLTLMLYISLGIYSYSYTLVTRFINSEKAQLQQRQLT